MDPTFLRDRIDVERDGEELTVWNHITVKQHHHARATEIQSDHRVLAGDGSTGEAPEYVTPAIATQLRHLDVYPDVEVVDPTDEEVTVL